MHLYATEGDLPNLGQLNRLLIEDENYLNSMDTIELSERMRGWLADGSHRIVVFLLEREVVGYASFRFEEEEVYLRQFFVVREYRRTGIGGKMLEILEREYF